MAGLQLVSVLLAHELPEEPQSALVECLEVWSRGLLPWKLQHNPLRSRCIGDVAQEIAYQHERAAGPGTLHDANQEGDD